MISTATKTTGAGTVTPSAVGLCSAGQVVRMASYAAPLQGTGVSVAGTVTPFRLRGLIATADATGAFTGINVDPTVLEGLARVGVPSAHVSTTPGALPPRDPLS